MKRCLLLLLVGCGAMGNMGVNPDASSGNGDAAPSDAGCSTVIAFDPPMPIADPVATIRAQAQVFGNVGVPSYTWSILHDNAETFLGRTILPNDSFPAYGDSR